MTTRLSANEIERAAAILRSGGTVAFPTETVYGLGANCLDPTAVAKIFIAKGRPADNPLIVHVADVDMVSCVAEVIPSVAQQLMEHYWPGPLTLVLGKLASVSDEVTAGLATVAVRMPNHRVALELIREANLPLAAPSANLSGRPSATSWQSVLEDLDGRIDAVICDEQCQIGIESTVLDLSGSQPIILRHGAITLEDFHEAGFKDVAIWNSNVDIDSAMLNSPGLRHRHYQPQASVVVIDLNEHGTSKWYDDLRSNGNRIAWIGLQRQPDDLLLQTQVVFDSIEEYSANLYETFRKMDHASIEVIVCEAVPQVGLGRALMDRLQRASVPRL